MTGHLILQIGFGSVMIVLATVIQILTVAMIMRLEPHMARGMRRPHTLRFAMIISVAAVGLLTGQTIGVWLWALALLQVGAFDGLEPSLYFALSAYTTLGFGDLLPPEAWRIFGAMIGANGMLAFGIAAAALLELVDQIRRDIRSEDADGGDKS